MTRLENASMTRRAVTFAFATLAALALASSACTTARPTGVVAGMTTQMQIPRDLKFVRVMAKNGSELILNKSYRVVDGTVRLPGSFTFAPADGVGRGTTIVLTVLGYEVDPENLDPNIEGQVSLAQGSTMPRVLRRAVLGYDESRVVYLPMRLSYACLGVQCKGAGDTCIAGKCTSDAIDATKLPTFVEGHFEASSEACFDATTCMRLELPARLAGLPSLDSPSTSAVDRCTFTVPDKFRGGETLTLPADTNLNVRVVFGQANPGDPASMPRSEVLDLGPEGFTIPDPTRPGVFRLADGLCDAALAAGASSMTTEVFVAPSKACLNGDCTRFSLPPTCTSKRPTQSLCQRDIDRTGPDATGGASCSESALTPSPSVLGILVDRRGTLRGPLRSTFFGAMIGMPLGGSLLRRTSVSLAFTPPTGNDSVCAGGAFATAAFETPSTFLAAAGSSGTGRVFGFDWTNAGDAVPKFKALQRVPELIAEPSFAFETAEYAGAYETFLRDHPAGLDVALGTGGGFFAAIRAQMGLSTVAAKRGALFIIGSREFAGTCGAGGEALTAVAAARAHATAPIDTFVLALADTNPNLDAAAQVAAAGRLATAGGTKAYAATARERADSTSKGLEALTEVAVEVATCTYDAPAGLTSATELSYMGIGGDATRVKIPGNATCAGDTGWRYEGTRVKLCATTCTAYRKAVRDRGLVAALGGASLEELPIVVRSGCTN